MNAHDIRTLDTCTICHEMGSSDPRVAAPKGLLLSTERPGLSGRAHPTCIVRRMGMVALLGVRSAELRKVRICDVSEFQMRQILDWIDCPVPKLTSAQLMALRMLAINPCYDGKQSFRRTTAEALQRHYLVKHWPGKHFIVGGHFRQGWMITEKGRELIEPKVQA